MSRILTSLLLCAFLLCHIPVNAQSTSEKVEPPFWWVGMEADTLQLMIHGEDVGNAKWSVEGSGARLLTQHKATSEDYVFLDVDLRLAQSGVVRICPSDQSNVELQCVDYELKERDASRAGIKGFDQSDALYLITPDRFVNGDARNDESPELEDTLNRSEPYGRHGGDIAGIINSLDYISDMGFTAIWLNPILENAMPHASYHGYATTDYYNVDSRYGSNEEYRNLVDSASARGVKIIMDMIANHCGLHHWWMEDPPFDNWINHQSDTYQQTSHRKETLLDPYVSPQDRARMTDGWFVPDMPDLNQKNRFMATYLIQNSIWWIEYAGISGIRQDTYSYPDRDFMGRWTCAIQREYPDFRIVGEEWTTDPATVAFWLEGNDDASSRYGFTSCLSSQMDFPLCLSMHRALTQEESWATGLIEIYQSLAQDHHYPSAEDLVIFPDNHDMSRIFTTVNEDYSRYQMALTLTATLRGIPQIYYGTEILMSNPGTDSHGVIRSDFPGGWPGDEKDALSGKGLSVAEKQAQDWVKKLFSWRRGHSTIHHGKLMHYVPEDNVYVYFRYDDNHSIMVVINKNEKPFTLELDRFAERILKRATPRIITSSSSCTIDDDQLHMEGPGGYIIEY